MAISIQPCIWLKADAAEAVAFYCSVFSDAAVLQSNPFAVSFQLFGRPFVALNGAQQEVNPSISFFVQCNTAEEVDAYWHVLSEGGKVMMPLDTYPWSGRYGWCSDRYGVNWQLMLHDEIPDRIFPGLMYIGQNNGKATEAMAHYTALIPDSGIEFTSQYEPGEADVEGNIKHARFTLAGRSFSCMESSADFGFQPNDALSIMLSCDTQEEIDLLWNGLCAGGSEGQCGWLKDRYGISWQVVPASLGKWIGDPVHGAEAMQRMLKMKKMIISELHPS